MTPKFSAAVDLVFQQVLDLLERIGDGENPSPQEERVRIRSRLDHAEAQLGRSPDWQLAKYALVAWIDEMLIVEAPWKDRDWWNENKLEWELFQTNDRYQLFYKKAKEAFALPQKDALETFYVCVVLGFRGLYRDPAAAAMAADALQLPRDLQSWTRETAMAIRLGVGRPSISEVNQPLEGAPPLNGPQMLVWGSFFALVLAAIVAIVYWLLIYSPTGA
jgi:type VI secretion system protein ImpK